MCKNELAPIAPYPRSPTRHTDRGGARTQERLQKLLSLIGDSIDLLGSDAMHVALDAYAQLKLSGGDAGLEELRKELGSRWSQGGRARVESPAPAPTPTPTPAPTPVLDPA